MPFHAYQFQELRTQRELESRAKARVSKEAIACRYDFLQFRRYVCNHDSWEHHLGWHSVLDTGQDSKFLPLIAGPNTLILAPRGSSKSTFLAEFVAWVLGRCTSPEIRYALKILYISFNQDVANGKSEQIKAIIETTRYQEVFPWVRPHKKRWNATLWDIDRKAAGLTTTDEQYTLATAGLSGTVTSRRSHLMVFDDLIKRPKDIENPAIRETMRSNFSNVIRPTLMDGGRMLCLGTRMRLDDIYATTFTEQMNWKVIEEQAILVDERGKERSYCPELVSLPWLQEARETDPDAFLLQYQNKIPPSMDTRFKHEWMHHGPPPRRFDEICLAADLSASQKETADYTVMGLIGRIKDTFCVIDMVRGRWSGNIEKFDMLLFLLIENGLLETSLDYDLDLTGKPKWERNPERGDFWLPRGGHYINIYADANSYQLSFQGDCETTIERLGLYFLTPWPIKAKPGDKLTKYRSMTGVFQRGKVFFNKYKSLGRIIYELENAGATDHDDCADMMYFGLTGLRATDTIFEADE